MNIQKTLIALSHELTQAEIGRNIGLSQATVSRLKKDSRVGMRFEAGKRLEGLAMTRNCLVL